MWNCDQPHRRFGPENNDQFPRQNKMVPRTGFEPVLQP